MLVGALTIFDDEKLEDEEEDGFKVVPQTVLTEELIGVFDTFFS